MSVLIGSLFELIATEAAAMHVRGAPNDNATSGETGETCRSAAVDTIPRLKARASRFS